MAILSVSIENVLQVLFPVAAPDGEGRFPPVSGAPVWRMSKSESPYDWLTRCSNELISPDRCFISDHLALFAEVAWSGGEFKKICMQALVSIDDSIGEFLKQGGKGESTYLRLDLDFAALGGMFGEPLPHIHGTPHGEPRFPFVLAGEMSPVARFLELLFLNYEHQVWQDWAEELWWDAYPTDEAMFQTIADAYKASQPEVLEKHYNVQIGQLKTLLFAAWRDATKDHPVLPTGAKLLSYW